MMFLSELAGRHGTIIILAAGGRDSRLLRRTYITLVLPKDVLRVLEMVGESLAISPEISLKRATAVGEKDGISVVHHKRDRYKHLYLRVYVAASPSPKLTTIGIFMIATVWMHLSLHRLFFFCAARSLKTCAASLDVRRLPYHREIYHENGISSSFVRRPSRAQHSEHTFIVTFRSRLRVPRRHCL